MARVVLKLGDDVSTDLIYPGRFMATVLPGETPQFAFADLVEFNAALRGGAVPSGSVIVGGQNFGCGSSREQAASCLKGHDLVIVARSFARIFIQNAVNVGLRTLVCPSLDAAEGQELAVAAAEITNTTTGRRFPLVPLPAARQAIVDAGGLIPYARKLVVAERK